MAPEAGCLKGKNVWVNQIVLTGAARRKRALREEKKKQILHFVQDDTTAREWSGGGTGKLAVTTPREEGAARHDLFVAAESCDLQGFLAACLPGSPLRNRLWSCGGAGIVVKTDP
jgi:hypothetical protein